MIDPRTLLTYGAAAAVIALGALALWQRGEIAQARRALADYQLASERATELQREGNRGRAASVEQRVVTHTVYRDRYITKTIKEIDRATQPLAACPVPEPARVLLNDAARCAREDRPASCGAVDAMRDTR